MLTYYALQEDGRTLITTYPSWVRVTDLPKNMQEKYRDLVPRHFQNKYTAVSIGDRSMGVYMLTETLQDKMFSDYLRTGSYPCNGHKIMRIGIDVSGERPYAVGTLFTN